MVPVWSLLTVLRFFATYTKKTYKQVIIGNTEPIVQMVREKLRRKVLTISTSPTCRCLFCKVEEFDYKGIAEELNREKYDIIWVSLGNPKQEIFMRNIEPLLKQGVMFGIGAALNFWMRSSFA